MVFLNVDTCINLKNFIAVVIFVTKQKLTIKIGMSKTEDNLDVDDLDQSRVRCFVFSRFIKQKHFLSGKSCFYITDKMANYVFLMELGNKTVSIYNKTYI